MKCKEAWWPAPWRLEVCDYVVFMVVLISTSSIKVVHKWRIGKLNVCAVANTSALASIGILVEALH